jgi:hypothetical protein
MAIAFLTSASFAKDVAAKTADNTLTQAEKESGWSLLFDGKSLDQWKNFKRETISKAWVIEDGAMVKKKGGGDLMTRKSYTDYEVKLDWKIALGGNSGIFILADEKGKAIYSHAPEIQLLDNERHKDNKPASHRSGSIYDMFAAPPESQKVAGEWNTIRILFQKRHLQVWQNGVQTTDVTIGSDDWKKALNNSKFKSWAGFAESTSGAIGLQEHGAEVSFKNLKIRVIE